MMALCEARNSALLVIDAQQRLLKTMAEAEQTVSNIQRLCRTAQLLEIPTLVTEQYPQGLGHTDEGILSSLSKTTKPLPKTGFSCCAAQGFNDSLTQSARTQIVLSGMETHVCVLQTALQLVAEGKQVFVVEDAVCSRKESHKQNALARLRQQGVIVSNVESVLFEWLRDSTHPHFKAVSALIR